MITAEDLSRTYGDFVAVDAVSFEIPHGAIVGLLGHNGAGKTTIMKMLTGYLEPSSGKALIDGVDVTEDRIEIQKKIGYLPENSPLYPEMTVIEYLEYVAELRETPVAERDACIQEAIAQTKLEEKATAQIQTLSRGYKQRVGVAQAVLHKPEILILDEPTNGLDPSQINDMRTLIKTLSESATVILSTHILQEVQAVCDRVLILSRGKLALNESLSNLSSDNKLIIESDADAQKLQGLIGTMPQVSEIEAVSAGGENINKSRIHLSESSHQIAGAISKEVIQSGATLYGLMKEEKNLESIFQEASAV